MSFEACLEALNAEIDDIKQIKVSGRVVYSKFFYSTFHLILPTRYIFDNNYKWQYSFGKTTGKIQSIKLFRLLLFTVFIGYLPFGLVSILEYGIFTFFIIALFLEVYLLILPAFILITRISNSYFLSIFVVVKVIGLRIKIIAEMLIVGTSTK
jgi:hypothetical protein